MEQEADWIEVVPASPSDEADSAWLTWLAERDEALAEHDVVIDIGRATYGTFKRYRVRRSALDT